MEKVWLSVEIVWKKLDEESAQWDGDKNQPTLIVEP